MQNPFLCLSPGEIVPYHHGELALDCQNAADRDQIIEVRGQAMQAYQAGRVDLFQQRVSKRPSCFRYLVRGRPHPDIL